MAGVLHSQLKYQSHNPLGVDSFCIEPPLRGLTTISTLSVTLVECAWKVIMGRAIKHYMNPLHIYCRLRELGLAKARAESLCRIYERIIFKHLMAKH